MRGVTPVALAPSGRIPDASSLNTLSYPNLDVRVKDFGGSPVKFGIFSTRGTSFARSLDMRETGAIIVA
jgi:hypothetical protein